MMVKQLSCCLRRLALPCLVLSVSASFAAAAASSNSIVSSSTARLPFGLQKVVADLQDNEDSDTPSSLTTACLITSRSVTRRQKKLLQQALAASSSEDGDDSNTAVATASGLVLAMPNDSDSDELITGTLACGGNVVYYPSAVDLMRGEGLFCTLAPVMEQILATFSLSTDSSTILATSSSCHEASLVVVVPDDVVSTDMAQAQLQKAAETVLSNLVVSTSHNGNKQPLSLLEDVFRGGVHFVSQSSLVSAGNEAVVSALSASSSSVDADAIASRISKAASAASSSSSSSSSSLTGNDLASARILGPKSRVILDECLESVLAQTGSGEQRKLVLGFGDLCRTSLQQGLEKLQECCATAASEMQSCTVTKQIRSNFVGQFYQGLADELQEQLSLLQAASFDEFKKGLSKLILGPNLASDMQTVGQTAIASFNKKAKQVVNGATATGGSGGEVLAATKQEFARQIKEQCTNRLLTAKANGKFRPLPRKGVTVGLHWLLPKPFGNDYRQEPWMVHAADNMVYVPQGSDGGKVQDVSPKDVASGDWKNKIVPSPIGNDMVYVQ